MAGLAVGRTNRSGAGSAWRSGARAASSALICAHLFTTGAFLLALLVAAFAVGDLPPGMGGLRGMVLFLIVLGVESTLVHAQERDGIDHAQQHGEWGNKNVKNTKANLAQVEAVQPDCPSKKCQYGC